MKNPDIATPGRTVLEPSDARQGNRKRTNLRVLIGSMVTIAIIGAGLLFVFFKSTPAGMDAQPTGAEAPASTAPAAPVTAPETTPTPTPPVTP